MNENTTCLYRWDKNQTGISIMEPSTPYPLPVLAAAVESGGRRLGGGGRVAVRINNAGIGTTVCSRKNMFFNSISFSSNKKENQEINKPSPASFCPPLTN